MPLATEAWLEWEVKPQGAPFDGVDVKRGERRTLSQGVPVVLEEVALATATPDPLEIEDGEYHWRGRVATTNPLVPCTSWFGIPGNNLTELKLRKPAPVGTSPP